MIPMTSRRKPSAVRVRLRSGNKSAQLERSIFRDRAGCKVPISIGSVDADANLDTGEGVRMKKPFTFADLTPEDKERIREKFDSVRGPDGPVVRPGFASLDEKLSRVLDLLGEASGQVHVRPAPQPTVDSKAGSALDRLDACIHDAIEEVRGLIASGVRPTRVSHTGRTAFNPNSRIDQLQARVNRVRLDLIPTFVKACRDAGLLKSGG
jgi:hypothetical protein